MTVVAGALVDEATTQVINPAISHVREVRRVVLHEAQGAGGPGPGFKRQARAQGDQVHVGAANGQVQEPDRVEDGMGDPVEGIAHRFRGQLGRLRAVGVAAHAVHCNEENGAIGGEHLNAILVLLAIANQAEVSVLDAQGNSR